MTMIAIVEDNAGLAASLMRASSSCALVSPPFTRQSRGYHVSVRGSMPPAEFNPTMERPGNRNVGSRSSRMYFR